jgi:DNA invertase Pin-like site-specific DNA recombinase
MTVSNESFVTYCRVSTSHQGSSGLGIEAQQAEITKYVGDRYVIAEFVEVGSARRNDRPKLLEALLVAKKNSSILIVASLDRLSRDASFVSDLIRNEVAFVCCDIPTADKMTLQMKAVFAEAESDLISKRTKAALNSAKVRGAVLGGDRGKLKEARAISAHAAQEHAAEIALKIERIKASGISSLRGIAAELNERNIPARRGGMWSASTVARIISRTQKR